MADERDKSLVDVLDLGEGPRPPRSDILERPRINGRPQVEFHIAYTRDLGKADMEALALPRAVAPRSLVRIHASHHSLARCLAAGLKPQQAALVTGYSPGRITSLQRDPAFASLVADYSAEVKSIAADLTERMVDMSFDAIELLQERMHDKPEELTVPVLLDIIKAFADRTGHGPNQEVSLRLTGDLIDRPPRETHEQWAARRAKELEGPSGPEKLN